MQRVLNLLKVISPVIRFVLLFLAGIQTYMFYRTDFLNFAVFIIIDLLIALNEIIRLCFSKKECKSEINKINIVISIFLSIIVIAAGQSRDYITFYYFFLLDNVFNMQRGKTRNILMAVHFIGFLGAECFRINSDGSLAFYKSISGVMDLIIIYSITFFIFAVIHYFKFERDRLRILNSNLIEYSFQEREYLIAKERGNISQELHDNLGHSLMALLMNVRYLKAIDDKSQEERRKVIDEIENLVKESVENLRGSVYSLRELDESINLREEIQRIIQKFDELNLVKIHLDYDDKIDKSSNYIKSILHKTIREGITNSIRHGNAAKINISIHFEEDNILLIIKDNGTGCDDIKKSFGLNGILDRVKQAGGEVYFISERNKGFVIKAVLPGGNADD